MHQSAVGVGLDRAVVIRHGDVRPLIQWRHIPGVNELPARTRVGKAPLNRAVRESRNHILAFFDNDRAAISGV